MKNTAFFLVLLLAFASPIWARGGNNHIDSEQKGTQNKWSKGGTAKFIEPDIADLDPRAFEYVRTNIISTVYHEMAHALIDTMEIPVYGQEEDAADVFSVVMVEAAYSEQEALRINQGAARGFESDHVLRVKKGREWNWADEHGPDMQRYFNIVCLTYGAHTRARKAFAKDMKLPDDRAEFCNEEYDVALNAWMPIIDQLRSDKNSRNIRFQHAVRSALHVRTAELISNELKAFNKVYHLPARLRVSVERCGKERSFYAYYAANRKKITICTNYIDELYRDGRK